MDSTSIHAPPATRNCRIRTAPNPNGKFNRITAKTHTLVKKAIKLGVLVRQPCEVCGTVERVHGHHDDTVGLSKCGGSAGPTTTRSIAPASRRSAPISA